MAHDYNHPQCTFGEPPADHDWKPEVGVHIDSRPYGSYPDEPRTPAPATSTRPPHITQVLDPEHSKTTEIRPPKTEAA